MAAVWLRNAEAADGGDYDVVWKAFSLEHVNLPEDADPDELWATPAERRGLLPLAAAKWAEAQGPDTFDKVHSAFFEARHVDRKKIGRPEVAEEVLNDAGLDGAAVVQELLKDRKWLDAARADHEEGADLNVFGVPTLIFPDCQPVFLRLLEITEGERAVDIWRRVKENARDPIFHEFKRAN